jgi:hypothetical protein
MRARSASLARSVSSSTLSKPSAPPK